MRGSRTFTTYMNIEPGAGNERALSTLERQAEQSLRRVANTAQRAGNLAGGIMPTTGTTSQIQMLAAAERARATALQRTTVASRQADAATRRAAGGMLLESNAARAAAANTVRLERSLRLASVAANVAQGPLGPIAGRLSAMATAVRELSGLRLGIVGIGAATAAFVRYAGTAQDLVSRLRPLYETQAQVNAAFKDAQYIANKARVGIEPVIDLYARLTLAGREAGLSQQRISRLTETAAKAAKLSGGAAASQEASLYQFSQGIGSGTLAGDELKSVREGTLRLAKAIADGLGVPMSALKKLGKEGKLTPKVIADALEKESVRIDAELAKLPATISSSTTQLSNAFLSTIKDIDEASGVAGAFAATIVLVAENLGGLVKMLGSLALAYAGFKTARIIQTTSANINAWNSERKAVLANATAAKEAAATQRRASADRVVSLRTERTALQQQVAAERAVLAEKTANARRSLTYVETSNRRGYSPDARGAALYRGALDEARVAADNLRATKARLGRTSTSLTGQMGVLTNSTRAYRTASLAASRASITFGNAARGLWAAINPLGLALAFAIPLLVEFAFRQDAAAGSADRMAEAQIRLARFVDQTTGKLLTQNQALIDNAMLESRDEAKDTRKAYTDKRKNLSFGGDSTLGTVYRESDVDKNLIRIRDQVREGTLSTDAAARQMGKLKGLNETSRGLRDALTRQLPDINALGVEAARAGAEEKFWSGDRSAETRRRMFGNFTGENADTVMGRPGAEGDADKKLGGARNERAKSTDAAAKAERELQQAQNRTDKRTDILARYDDQPTAIDKSQRDIRELDQLIGKAMEVRDAFGEVMSGADGKVLTRLYTDEMAAADQAAIEFGVLKPIRDAIDEQERGLEISRLRLGGYDLEADALETALGLQDQIGQVSRDDLATLIQNAERQRDINDLLESRERRVSQILALSEQTRDSFEDMLVGLRKDPIGSIKKFGAQIMDNIVRVEARRITESLFGGVDAKLRDLVNGTSGVDRAADILESHVKSVAESIDPLRAANDNLTTSTETLTTAFQNLTAAVPGPSGGTSGLAPSATLARADQVVASVSETANSLGNVAKTVFGSGGNVAGIAGAVSSVAAAAVRLGTQGDQSTTPLPGEDPDPIAVTGARSSRRAGTGPGPVPSGTQAYNTIFEKLGGQLDKTFKSGSFFSGIGKGVGKAFAGAAIGQTASSVVGLTGLKQSKAGATIGGAVGAFIPVIGPIIGGIIGGTLGGLLKKTKSGSANVTIGSDGQASAGATAGNSAGYKKTATGLAGAVGDQINQLSDALGAQISGVKVSIGQRKDKFTVDPTGANRTKGSGVLKFSTEAEAQEAALRDAISDMVIGGVSAASAKILKSGQDLTKALNKALAIESIPKRLLARTDPVRFAVQTLNDEFTKLISYLKEGSATTAQFADAQKLYELERADAITQASAQASKAIQSFLDDMTGGSSSPLNKRTVYANASDKLNAFRGDIAAGKKVSEDDLLTASRAFQEASRALFGSGQQFFSDFDGLFALLSKARDNVGTTTGGTLPASPFQTDSQVAAMLGQLNGATQSQTDILAGKLDQLIGVFESGYVPALYGSGAIAALPGFGAGRVGESYTQAA